MLAGTVVSAVMGGLAGLAVAMTRDHTLLQTLMSYQLGGGLAVLAFLAVVRRETAGRS